MASNVIFDCQASYRAYFRTGLVTTAAAGGILAAWQWTSSPLAVRVRAIEASFALTTAFTSAQEMAFDVSWGRSFTVAPNTNNTAITLTGNNQKFRASMATSSWASAQVCTTAGMGGATVTPDASPVCGDGFWASAVGTGLPWRRWSWIDNAEENACPMVGQNEGILFRNTILMGAAGVGRFSFYLEWEEGLLATP